MLRDCAKSLKRSQSAFGCRKFRLESASQPRTEPHRADFIAASISHQRLTAKRAQTSTPGRVCNAGRGDRRRTRMRCGPVPGRPRSAGHRALSARQPRPLRRRVPRPARVERARIARRSPAPDVGRRVRDDHRMRRSERNDRLDGFGRVRIGHHAARGDRVGGEHRKRWPRKTSVTRASCGSRHQ